MHQHLRWVGARSHHGARAWSLVFLLFLSYYCSKGMFSRETLNYHDSQCSYLVSGVAVIRTLTQLDLIADSASVIGVGADGLTTFRVFEDDVYDGSSTSILTREYLIHFHFNLHS
jgi:hypothetical protein